LAVGDVNADGFADILTGQGKGGHGQVEVFSGIKLYEQMKGSNGDVITGQKASRQALLFNDVFKPYGSGYRGAVDVTASYALPRGFDAKSDSPDTIGEHHNAEGGCCRQRLRSKHPELAFYWG